MNTRTYLSVAGAIGIIFGLGYLLVPVLAGGLVFKFDTPASILFGRFIGAYLLMWGAIGFVLRNSTDKQALRGVLQVTAIGHVITIALFLIGLTSGVSSVFGWGNVILSVVLGIGAIYCLPRGDVS